MGSEHVVRRTGGAARIAVVAIALAGAVAAGAAERSRSLVPVQFREAVQLTIEGKARDYWTLDRDHPVEITVRGPGRVKLITRLGLAAPGASGDYGIVVREGDEEITRAEFRVLSAKGVKGAGFPAWGRHRSVTVTVPSGAHTYRVGLAEGSHGVVALRPRAMARRRSPRRLSITPASYERVLTLIRDEKEISYYLLTPDAPVRVTVLGPTELQVNTRLDFDALMKGGVHGYAIEVVEGDTPLTRRTYEVTRSQVTAYRDRPEIVPGVVKSATVPLGSGVHDLDIRLSDTVARGVAVKLFLPAKDVN